MDEPYAGGRDIAGVAGDQVGSQLMIAVEAINVSITESSADGSLRTLEFLRPVIGWYGG